MKTVIIISLLLCLTASVAFAKIIPDGLVLYFPFDETAGAPADKSPTNAKAVIQGTLKRVDGKYGKALNFDGNAANFVQVDHAKVLEGMEQLTIEVWVKPQKPDALARGIISKRATFQSGDVYNLFSWNETKFWARVNANQNMQVNSETILKDNTWYHLAYVFDGKVAKGERQKLYVNGKLEMTKEHPDTAVGKGEQPLYIGTLNADYAQTWNGLIDEVRIWTKSLTEAEINDNMEKGANELLSIEPNGKLTITWGQLKRITNYE